MKSRQLIIALGAVLVLLEAFGPAVAAPKCDRQCLVDLMQQYLAALVKHDPGAVPFGHEVKFVENTANIPVGYGLWVTASRGPSDFQIYAADPVGQQVACLVMMKENNNQDVLVGVRLRLQRGKIAEAEHHVIRENLANSLPNLQKSRPGLVEDLDPADRTPRDQMIDIGLSYYDALTGEDGTLAPMADECERHENGMVTAGGKPPEPKTKTAPKEPAAKLDSQMESMMKAMAAMPRSCTGQISTGTFAYITDIKNRRLVVADEQKGLAVGISMFYHDSKLKTMKLGSAGMDTVPAFRARLTCRGSLLQNQEGQIYDIEATVFHCLWNQIRLGIDFRLNRIFVHILPL
jgi:hypothetical protein